MKLDSYHIEFQPLLVVISGPSGAGKDTVVKRMKELGYPFYFVVTATTRPKRTDEVDGIDYHFVSEGEFARMLEDDELLEHAIVYGQQKGIPKEEVRQALESGKDAIMRIDVQGAATIRKLVPEAVFIFITAPSEEKLIRRLKKRHTERPKDFKKRMATARQEMERLLEFDYVVVNRDGKLDETVEKIAAIVSAEKCRV
ncbi:MAG: guanylate kinase, partial [Chloroflexota bacterium]|nr:guanylate kinase [Chloroflexota bacterium]